MALARMSDIPEEEQRVILCRTLRHVGGSTTKAARYLGVERDWLLKRLDKLGLRGEPRRQRDAARRRFRLVD